MFLSSKVDLSIRYKIISASSIFHRFFYTQIFNFIFCFSNTCSINKSAFNAIDIYLILNIVSVVPGIELTIAFFINKQFKVDLPLFGFPTITIGKPFFITFPILKDLTRSVNFISMVETRSFNLSMFANSTSS